MNMIFCRKFEPFTLELTLMAPLPCGGIVCVLNSGAPRMQLFASPVLIDPTTGDLTFVLEPFHNGEVRPQPSTLNPQPSTLNPQPSTLNPQPSNLKFQTSNLKPQPSQLSTLIPRPSTLNTQHSTLNTQFSAPKPQAPATRISIVC